MICVPVHWLQYRLMRPRKPMSMTFYTYSIHSLIYIPFLDLYTDLVMQLEDQECYAQVLIPAIQTGRAGRPPFSVSQSQIEVLVELGYSYAQLARMLGISDRTLLRRREMFGLPIGQSYSNIIDAELDVIVRAIQ